MALPAGSCVGAPCILEIVLCFLMSVADICHHILVPCRVAQTHSILYQVGGFVGNPLISNRASTASLSPFPRTRVPTALSAMPLSTCPPPLRLSVPSLSSPARRSLSVRSPSSLPASPRLLARRLRVPMVSMVRATAVASPPVAVAVLVVAGLAVPVVAVPEAE